MVAKARGRRKALRRDMAVSVTSEDGATLYAAGLTAGLLPPPVRRRAPPRPLRTVVRGGARFSGWLTLHSAALSVPNGARYRAGQHHVTLQRRAGTYRASPRTPTRATLPADTGR